VLGTPEYVGQMNESVRSRARSFIIVGYLVVAVGTLASFCWQASTGYLRLSSEADVNLFAQLFASFAFVGAWWFLTQLDLDTSRQLPLIRKAFFGFGLATLLTSTIYLVLLFAYVEISWPYSLIWATGFGNLIASMGFFLTWWDYRSTQSTPEPTPLGRDESPTFESI
jgi:hypothetical protein